MKKPWLVLAGAALSLGTALTASEQAAAQPYPAKPVRIVVPYPPGGGADNVGRVLAAKLAQAFGQQVVIDNRGGASGIIGADLVAKSPPDGYTVWHDATAHSVNPSLRKLPYETLKDLVPVVLLVVNPNLLVVHPSMPARNLADVVALARARPGQITYATSGLGTVQHMAGELFRMEAKVNLVHVPYKGGGQALPEVIGGQVDMFFSNIASGLTHVKSGKLRALVVTAEKRSPSAPDVPTVGESGYPGVVAYEWNGIFVPGGTPREIILRLNAEYNKAMAQPDVKERFFALGAEAAGGTPEAFLQYLRVELAKWDRVVRQAAIRME